MNWLAHVFLSEPNTEFRLGNLLADVVRGPARAGISNNFQRGAECHRVIDAFTDAHPIVRRSRARISARHRRFSGVLIDVFYDYFLSRNWHTYAAVSLDEFLATFYAEVDGISLELPNSAQILLLRVTQHNVLGSYREIDGIHHSLQRLSAYLSTRWQRIFALDEAISDLLEHEAALADDFATFFPELQAHVSQRAKIEIGASALQQETMAVSPHHADHVG